MNRSSKDQRIAKLERDLEESERENYKLREDLKNMQIAVEKKVG